MVFNWLGLWDHCRSLLSVRGDGTISFVSGRGYYLELIASMASLGTLPRGLYRGYSAAPRSVFLFWLRCGCVCRTDWAIGARIVLNSDDTAFWDCRLLF